MWGWLGGLTSEATTTFTTATAVSPIIGVLACIPKCPFLEKRRKDKLMKAIQKEEKNKERQVDESNPKRREKEQKESEILL